jgi:cytochrome c oxidase subunit 4
MASHDKDMAHFHPSFATYIKVFSTLIFLTFLTVATSRFDFGSLNAFVAFGIATLKACLVAAIFMHLKYDDKMNRYIIISAFFFLGVFYFFCALDNFTRIVQVSTL